MRYGFIYETTNLINGMKYLGSHARTMSNKDDPDDSWYLGSGVHLCRAIAYYGVENFRRVILSEADSEEELSKLETDYLTSIDAANNPMYYNLTNSGYNRGSLGRICDEDSRKKMCDHNYVKLNGRTEESKKKQSATLKEQNHQGILADIVRGSVWITDGISNRRISPDKLEEYTKDDIWHRGYTSDRSHIIVSDVTKKKRSENMKRFASTPEGKKFYNTMNNDPRRDHKGKVWINREGEKKLIYPELLESYLSIGWRRGMK